MPIDPSNLQAGLTWRWRHFSLFSVSEWHEVLRLRTAVFVVEQECPYQEVDDKDPVAWHLELHHDGELIGTLRILPPGIAYQECSLGRVAVRADYRRLGLGRDVMSRALVFCDSRWPAVRLSAQLYLKPFYESLGFTAVGESYLEDDIHHIEMLRAR
jgi:ElaA protein